MELKCCWKVDDGDFSVTACERRIASDDFFHNDVWMTILSVSIALRFRNDFREGVRASCRVRYRASPLQFHRWNDN